MTGPRQLHVVVPAGIDDPTRPTGGNTYDSRLCRELATAGWAVTVHGVPGAWPAADDAARRALCAVLEPMPAGCLVLVDALVASTVPEVLVPVAARLRLAVLVHLPAGWQDSREAVRGRECAVLGSAAAVITTSDWCRRWLLDTYPLDPARVLAARPGVDLAEPAGGTDGGSNLLCVGAVAPAKGHDVLLAALGRIADLPWRCLCVGPVTVDPGFVADLRREACRAGLDGRFVLTGPLSRRALADRYAAADVLVLASRAETYGMVVTEALARALPVVTSDVGGLPEALGVAPTGRRPGLLVAPGDVGSWSAALGTWLREPSLRRSLRREALRRREDLRGWSDTAGRVARALREVAA